MRLGPACMHYHMRCAVWLCCIPSGFSRVLRATVHACSYVGRVCSSSFPPAHSSTPLQSAQSLGAEWVAGVERELGRFLADPSGPRRTSLPAGMSQAQRALVHELAAHWGLATHSIG